MVGYVKYTTFGTVRSLSCLPYGRGVTDGGSPLAGPRTLRASKMGFLQPNYV